MLNWAAVKTLVKAKARDQRVPAEERGAQAVALPMGPARQRASESLPAMVLNEAKHEGFPSLLQTS